MYLILGVYLVPGGVPGPGGCTWFLGGVPGPRGLPGPGGCTWGVYLPRYFPCGQNDKTGVKILPCPKLGLRAVMRIMNLGTSRHHLSYPPIQKVNW